MTYEIQEGAPGGLVLRGGALALWPSKDREVIICGPAECVSGDTCLYDPIDHTAKPIREFVEKQVRPVVLTLWGPAHASIPFLKGHSMLYRVVADDGSSFTATARHLVLTPSGFVYVSSLRRGQPLLSYSLGPGESSLEHGPSEIAQGAFRFGRIAPSSPGRYLSCLHRDGGQLRRVQIVQSVGMGDYYDLTVPGIGHYFAEGFIHHNTGKTYAALHRLDLLAWKYPGAQIAIVRKTYKSAVASVIQTFTKKVASPAVTPFGGEHPEWFDYPTKSRVWVGGMDNADKILSSERDFIYVNQAEELALSDWETLLTRCTGRAGNTPYAQLFGDCNPAGQRHWIRERAASGRLCLIQSRHQDNPNLYASDGQLTEQGTRTLAVLNDLTGIRRKRLLEGEWATAEGAVYSEFNHDAHVHEFAPETFVRWILAVDEGFTNPAVILLIGLDADGRMHIAREFYQSRRLQSDVVKVCAEWALEYGIRHIAVDAAAAGLIADLRNAQVWARPHKGRVQDGIALVQDRLKVQADGRPRLTVDPACTNTINEFESYVWKPERNEPIKADDHAMDALRYGAVSLAQRTGTSLIGGEAYDSDGE